MATSPQPPFDKPPVRPFDADGEEDAARLAAALAGRYTLERELGRGGMATVYLARDVRHRRAVALKVLDPHLGTYLGAARFAREIETAANLAHPHILALHDSGAADGLLYYVMPYVAGETLRDRLRRAGGPLPSAEALRILREVADALDHAHRHGVVHRDVKPENVLLDEDGHALVADFGIARAIHRAATEGAAARTPETLTQTGLAVGTPAYMSPEQAAGGHDVDGRSDVYALGCVAFELLSGEPPFRGSSAEQIAQHFKDPPSLCARLPQLPVEADAAVRRALALRPDDRYATATAFVEALDAATGAAATSTPAGTPGAASGAGAPARERADGRGRRRLAAGVAGGLLVLASVVVAARRAATREPSSSAQPLPAVASPGSVAGGTTRVAVLPFENLGRSEDAYLVDGMGDEVRGKLAGLRTVEVIARASSNQYRGTKMALAAVAHELGVEYLLTATVRSIPGTDGRPARVRVSPELVRVTAGRAPVTAWAHPFDADVADVFQVQSDIAQRVAEGLDVELGAGDQTRLTARPTANLAAYDVFLQAERVSNGLTEQSTPALVRAVRLYERAVALDSTFALGWARLGVARAELVTNSAAAAVSRSAARRAAERALALAPELPDARLAMGHYFLQIEHDPAKATEQFTAGLDVAPNDVALLTGAAWAAQALGRWDVAHAHLRRATVIDPRSTLSGRWLGVNLLWRRRYPEARAALERTLALDPADATTLHDLAMVPLAEGDLAGARAVLRRAPKAVDPVALAVLMGWAWDLGWALDDAGQRLLLGAGPEAFGGDRLSWGLALAQVHAARGDDRSARLYADSARLAAAAALRNAPEDAQLHVLSGVALAYVGRRDEAVRAGRRGAALVPLAKDGFNGAYYQHQLARIYAIVGEPEAALDQLEPLLRTPYFLSPAWLRIDPTFAPLRDNPRFERLAAGR